MRRAPVYMCLDEVANMAPIHDLPSLVSRSRRAGATRPPCLQDLSQARKRWGDAADGFLSLFQTKVILNGIADPKTLEAVSLCLGEYDRHVVNHTIGRSDPDAWFFEQTHATDNESVSYHTTRQRTLPPGDIACLPPGRALHLQGTRWGLIRSTLWHRTLPWKRLVSQAGE